MTLNASPVPAGRSIVVEVTSTGSAFSPRSRSALSTAAPEANETWRSEPGPPINTAILIDSKLMIGL